MPRSPLLATYFAWCSVHLLNYLLNFILNFTKFWTISSSASFLLYSPSRMATCSSVLAWRIPGTGEPAGLPSMGSHRVEHDWSNWAASKQTENFLIYLKNKSKLFPKICRFWLINYFLPTSVKHDTLKMYWHKWELLLLVIAFGS